MQKPCPECQKTGHDSDGTHLWLMQDQLTFYCKRKEYHIDGKPYIERGGKVSYQYTSKDVEKYEEEYASMEEITKDLQIFEQEFRDIRGDIFNHFGIKYSVNEDTGQPKALYFPITKKGSITGHHIRDVEQKKFANTGNTKGPKQLMFQSKVQAGGKKLLICEGAYDALSAYQMLKDKYPNFEPSVVSTNNGTGSGLADIRDNLDFIQSFEEVLLCFDNDDPGDKLTSECAKLIGSKAKVVSFNEKDVNDMLIEGYSSAFLTSFFSAKIYSPSCIVTIGPLVSAVVAPVEWGLSYPWKSMTDLTYGLRTKQTISIAAAPGGGKTTFIQQIQKHLMFEHKEAVGIFSLEEDPITTFKMLAGSIVNKRIHIPDAIYSKQEVEDALTLLDGKAYLYDGTRNVSWEDVISTVRYFASIGIKYMFIDPMSELVADLSASDANTKLNQILLDMKSMRKELDITFFSVYHLNNSLGKKDHGDGAKVRGSQFSGSRAAWRFSNALWGLERDQGAEDEVERNTTIFRSIKDRFSGNTGTFKLYYNSMTGIFDEQGPEEEVEIDI